MTQRSFELINDYYFKLLNLGIICYAAKANYYKNRYQSAAIKKTLKRVALIMELEARKLVLKVWKNNTVSGSIDLELWIPTYNLKAWRHMIVFKNSFLAREDSYGQRMVRCDNCARPSSVLEIPKKRVKPWNYKKKRLGVRKNLTLVIDWLLSNCRTNCGTSSRRHGGRYFVFIVKIKQDDIWGKLFNC